MRNLTKEEQKKYTEAVSKVYKPTGVNINVGDIQEDALSLRIENERLRARVAELAERNEQLEEANATLSTMHECLWVEVQKLRAESQGITNKLHELAKLKKEKGEKL